MVKRVYGQSYPEVYTKALPDTLVWRDKLGYNEPYVTQYLRHPAYDNYPVVGVSWTQANDFCVWRTDRVNERILINEGILKEDPEQIDDNTFNTEAYLAGQYDGIQGRLLRNYDPSTGEKFRKVKMEDGILLLSIDSQQRLSGNLLHLDMLATQMMKIFRKKNIPLERSIFKK